MRLSQSALSLFLLLAPLIAAADPEGDLRNAVSALGQTSYAWETTTRQRFSGETTEPRLNLKAPLEVQGKFDSASYTQITLLASRELPVPATVVSQQGDLVAHTPVGWLRRTEMRQTPADRDVTFEGKQVRLSRFFSVALKAGNLRPLHEDLIELVAELKSCRNESGLIIAELRDRTIEQLGREPEAKRAPEIQGTVIFKLSEQGLTEYHVVLAVGFPNSRTKKIAWSMQQWTTRITGIGSTRVEPPEAAVRKLAE